MKTRGFTLVELLGIIVVLGIIATIATPIVQKTIRENREKMYDVIVSQITDSARDWAATNSDSLPEEEGGFIDVTFDTLKTSGILQINTQNPNNNKVFSNQSYVRITKKNNNFIYEVYTYDLVDADEVEDDAPTITLNGDQVVNLKVGDDYVDSGIVENYNINKSINLNSYDIGTKYSIDPGDGTIRDFYVLSHNSIEVSLIMNENIDGPLTWSEAKGEAANLKYSWTNVNDVTLPTYNQISSIVDDDTYWLVENLNYPDSGYPAGYYTSTLEEDLSYSPTEKIWFVRGFYGEADYSMHDVMTRIPESGYDFTGLRPVIVLYKKSFSIQIIKNEKEVSIVDTSEPGVYNIYYSWLGNDNKLGINMRTVIVK